MPNILKHFSADVRKAILVKQAELKSEKKNGSLSQGQAISQIVKEWIELKKPKPTS